MSLPPPDITVSPDPTQASEGPGRWFWPGVIALALAAAVVGYVEARPSTGPATAATGPDPAIQTIPDPGPIEPLDATLVGLDGADVPSAPGPSAPASTAQTSTPASTASTASAPTLPAAPTLPPATVAPTPTAPPPTIGQPAGIPCTSAEGWSVTYPADWYTADGEWACTLFAPWPVVLEEASEPDVAIFSLNLEMPLDEALNTAVPDHRALLDWFESENDGVRTVTVMLEELEDAYYAAGTIVYEVYVATGATTVMFETWHEGGDAPFYGPVVDQLAATFRPAG